MVERRELITMCRQIGGMMEAGVDILRITQVLRAQTENPRLLALYDALDHDLRMGHSIGDAMAHAPDVFSPFMVSLVQQGELRNNLGGAFLKIADFLQQEQQEQPPEPSSPAPTRADSPSGVAAASTAREGQTTPVSGAATLSPGILEDLLDRLQRAALDGLVLLSGLLLSLAFVWWMVEIGLLERRWSNVALCSVAAFYLGGTSISLRRRLAPNPARQQDNVAPLPAATAHDANRDNNRKESPETATMAETVSYAGWVKPVEGADLAFRSQSQQVAPAPSALRHNPATNQAAKIQGTKIQGGRTEVASKSGYNNRFMLSSDEDEESYE